MNHLEKDQFIQAVKNNITIAGVLREIGRALVGSNYKYVKTHVTNLKLDTSHWKGQAHGGSSPRTYSNEQMFVKDSTLSTQVVKKRILRDGLIEYKCSNCKIIPIWDNRPLVFRLDHINGIRNDNRIENLRFLCPNCDSQTSTFCGKNKHIPKHPKTPREKKISTHFHPTKINWPPLEQLLEELKSISFVALGKKLGVSDNALRKHIKYQLRKIEAKSLTEIDPNISI